MKVSSDVKLYKQKMLKVLVLVVLACVQVQVQGSGCQRVVCYYTNWAQYRPGIGKFFPENIDPKLCTHFIYAFAKLQGNKLAPYEWNDESTKWRKGMYERFAEVTSKNPKAKTLLSVGGWNMGSFTFTQMVSSAADRKEFATSSVKFLRDHKFHGLDIDWEYPANRGSPPADRDRYTDLLKKVRQVFDADTSGPKLLLTAAVAAGKSKIDTAYNITEISKYLDFINLMSFDLHGSWEPHTGINSPLYPDAAETGQQRYLNVDWAAKYWVKKGAPKDKLVIGVPTYGRSFTLQSAQNSSLGAPTNGPGRAGQFTRQAGFLSYYEIGAMQKAGGQVHRVADQGNVPYIVKGNQWIGYDDRTSLKTKVDYIKKNEFGGIMIWDLPLDDFMGSLGQGNYSLIHTIVSECAASGKIQRKKQVQQQAEKPSNEDRQTVRYNQKDYKLYYQGADKSNEVRYIEAFSCHYKPHGSYSSTTSCSEYYTCAGNAAFLSTCARGLIFNPRIKNCDLPSNYHCKVPKTTSQQVSINYDKWRYLFKAHLIKSPTRVSVDIHNYCLTHDDGIHADPTDDRYYLECANHVTWRIACAPGTVFIPEINNCNFP